MDLRKNPRCAVYLPVSILEDDFNKDCLVGRGLVYNLSLSGCRVEGRFPVEKGNFFGASLHIPGQDIPVRVELATVRWTTGRDFGIEFLSLNTGEKERLGHFVSTFEQTASYPYAS